MHIEMQTPEAAFAFPTWDSQGASLRELFAVQILNGLVAKYGVPLGYGAPDDLYRAMPSPSELMRDQEIEDEEMEAGERERNRICQRQKDEYVRKLTAEKRALVCRQAVLLADELIAQLTAK